MPRKLERALSPMRVKTAPVGMHADGGCLYLQVTQGKNGLNRSWVFRYGTKGPNGKTVYREHGLGSLATLSLAEARDKARALRQARLDGVDPIEKRRAARATPVPVVKTFAEVADRWVDAKSPEWRPDYRKAQLARLRDYVFPAIGRMDVAQIDTVHVTAILDSIWRSVPNTATLVRSSVERVLDFATTKGWRPRGDNPARWNLLRDVYAKPATLRTIKRKTLGQGDHHAALPYADVAAFMKELRALPDDVAAWALEFCILTAARSGEVRSATWAEINMAERTWTCIAGRVRKHAHRVPLSDAAIAVLQKAAAVRTDDKVFPGLAVRAMRDVLQVRLGRAGITTHGFRSAFRDWAGEQTNFPREVCEAALAHYVSGTEGAYARGDLSAKRTKLMAAWANFCGNSKVLPLRQVK